jgi:hypothetical protein
MSSYLVEMGIRQQRQQLKVRAERHETSHHPASRRNGRRRERLSGNRTPRVRRTVLVALR